ncbi:hypothetical protein PHYSODRAFT_352675 [Phytophthora sojae]|uniref:CSC1/OSCA1-like cytosolic domain-containing protein n=1 Tax=Phytophthora sojae (strain P6497) TaxID=1094619 RepID=G5A5U2_PHYSP|nr:hypothetical protein PHYSODRAFT_352675 [Phytophthora sojae]EGZ08697.1 hypothetical protein PHYSODRAFT_352675 [Phytophthora sojae]|eukprot:XP_009535330.1 hypothetical protein PHYSODRAFT_352675 [Phytophthora sojae]
MEPPQQRSRTAARLSVTAPEDGPSVAVAQQWLRDVILPHRVRDKEAGGAFRLVDMGEDSAESELFPVWGTSLDELSAFGIGLGLYFRMLLQLSVLLFVLAAVSTPSIVYFASAAYSGALGARSLDFRILGTAACTREVDAIDTGAALYEVRNVTVNDCPLVMRQLHVDMVGLLILAVYCIAVAAMQTRDKARLDALEQTASDYSVVVKDPNANAWDPDEWERFFAQFGRVKFVTVCVDNKRLLSALAKKRYMEEMLKMESADAEEVRQALENAADPTKAAPKQTLLRRLRQSSGLGGYDVTYWNTKLNELRRRICTMLSEDSYRVWSVFVMFETEEAQRRCLRETRMGLFSTQFDWTNRGLAKRLRFRGTNILHVEQAVEPSSVRWNSAGVLWRWRMLQQALTISIVGGMMAAVYFLTLWLKETYIGDDLPDSKRRGRLFILAYTLAMTDLFGCRILSYVDKLEQHQTKEREQLSTLNKLLLFRGFNGAVVLYLLMDFTDVLSQENLLQIQALLIANLITAPVIQLISPFEKFYRWYYGPKAKTQRKLNSFYSGAYWKLAERYTQITKSVGIALFFKSLLPTGLIITGLSLLVNYWVDKYCLLRKWKTPPRYDGLLARASRYHLLLVVLVSLIMMGHWYNGWPFDRYTQRAVEAAREKTQSKYDSLVNTLHIVLPFLRDDYPTTAQRNLMDVLYWIILVVTCMVVAFVLLKSLYRSYMRYIVGNLPSGFFGGRAKQSDIPASQVFTLNGYVPSYESRYTDFPYLSVPLDSFEPRYVSWSGNHEAYCLVNDVLEDPQLAESLGDKPLQQLFGACKQYDMPGAKMRLP